MKIVELLWNKKRIAHIDRHDVTPIEFEQVVFSDKNIVYKRRGGRYCIFGQTDSGRYLLCVVRPFKMCKGIPVTSRNMKKKEKRKYKLLSR